MQKVPLNVEHVIQPPFARQQKKAIRGVVPARPRLVVLVTKDLTLMGRVANRYHPVGLGVRLEVVADSL